MTRRGFIKICSIISAICGGLVQGCSATNVSNTQNKFPVSFPCCPKCGSPDFKIEWSPKYPHSPSGMVTCPNCHCKGTIKMVTTVHFCPPSKSYDIRMELT